MVSYQELLTDPRWQKKRLEIFLRDDFTCQRCGETRKTLCVHHLAYQPGLNPWEYKNTDLITWCVDCHENDHIKLKFQDIADRIISQPYSKERSLLLDRLIIEYGI